MTLSEETLMAFADGELDAASAAEVEAAMRADANVERRVAQHRALRDRLCAAFEPQLHEHVPERLLQAARGARPVEPPVETRLAAVHDLSSARAARGARTATSHSGGIAARRQIWAVAASLLLGVGIGFALWRMPSANVISGPGGALLAHGALARSLAHDLSGDRSSSHVRIGLTFQSKDGTYCRTFTAADASGYACNEGGKWRIAALAQEAHSNSMQPEYRTASSTLPPLVLRAVEEAKAGEPLDRNAELKLLNSDWSAEAK